MLCGLTALALSAGAMAGQDRTNQPMQNSTPSAQTNPSTTPSAAERNAALNDRNDTSMSATAQTKFDALDVNHDGAISKQEAQASKALDNEFARLDADKNSKLSLSEFMSAQNLASIKVDKTKMQKDESKKDYR
jgi:hypothetical protein